VNENNELLCSYSNNRSELWVSLIEKAYMKVNGGYNFPGSNSGIDLHALTGWIPEEIIINGENFNMTKIWKQMMNAYHYGDCLITISTGALDEELAEELGLYEKHAYAVLNVKEVRGYKLLQVKNPWTQKRWKGKFSPVGTI
jgi:calpain-7